MKRLIKRILRWALKPEIERMEQEADAMARVHRIHEENKLLNQRLRLLLNNFGAGLDVEISGHKYARSWAVVCLQGEKADFVKFVDLGDAEIREIQRYIYQFERGKTAIDAAPQFRQILKFQR
jgi:uncharacterized protein with von Willebrand factor type A (vWA) domain